MVDEYTLWLREQAQQLPAPPLTLDQKIAALRAEVEGLRGRLKDELIESLRVEVERAIALRLVKRSTTHTTLTTPTTSTTPTTPDRS